MSSGDITYFMLLSLKFRIIQSVSFHKGFFYSMMSSPTVFMLNAIKFNGMAFIYTVLPNLKKRKRGFRFFLYKTHGNGKRYYGIEKKYSPTRYTFQFEAFSESFFFT
jgi:hypothetical protein